jgi:hypothetical protein
MKLTALSLQKRLTNLAVTLTLLIVPMIGFTQVGPPPPNEGGGNPEVPFDSNMNMIFLAAGVLFAVIITVRQLRKKASVTA